MRMFYENMQQYEGEFASSVVRVMLNIYAKNTVINVPRPSLE